jgi:hypothetical protein
MYSYPWIQPEQSIFPFQQVEGEHQYLLGR